jgi:hypothetical protein
MNNNTKEHIKILRVFLGGFLRSTWSLMFRPAFLRDKDAHVVTDDMFLYSLGLAMDAFEGKDALFLEFGVANGDSINKIARFCAPRTIYGFDSFYGLGRAWRTLGKGAFNRNGKLPAVRDNVVLVKGLFSETLPHFVSKHKNARVAFMHIDCDLYESTKDVFDNMKELNLDGAIISFDELWGYGRDWKNEEYRAFSEFLNEHSYTAKYLAYNPSGWRVSVRINKTRSGKRDGNK